VSVYVCVFVCVYVYMYVCKCTAHAFVCFVLLTEAAIGKLQSGYAHEEDNEGESKRKRTNGTGTLLE